LDSGLGCDLFGQIGYLEFKEEAPEELDIISLLKEL